MSEPRHLSRAPIIEALIDIQTTPREGLTFDELKQAYEALDFGYYIKGPISEGLFSLVLPADGKEPGSTATASQIGLRLHSKDERYVLQCRVCGFTLSRLQPYEDWTQLITEAGRLWAIYCDQLKPQRITRIATRFINNLQLPMPQGASFQQYIVKLVDVPEGVPQSVTAFFQRFHLMDPDAQAAVVLTLALDAGTTGPQIPVILDIDAFTDTDINVASALLWQQLEQLRQAKNRVFFQTLTEKTMELYQ